MPNKHSQLHQHSVQEGRGDFLFRVPLSLPASQTLRARHGHSLPQQYLLPTCMQGHMQLLYCSQKEPGGLTTGDLFVLHLRGLTFQPVPFLSVLCLSPISQPLKMTRAVLPTYNAIYY